MKDIKWLADRLKAMKPQEMWWRLQQSMQQSQEKDKYYLRHLPVTEIPIPVELAGLHVDENKLSINWENKEWTEFERLDLFSVFSYEEYKDKWDAGFQTETSWPEYPYSPTIHISQRMDIGDIRTNWEINRHFQFVALAKSYYCTKDYKYFEELERLFYGWNKHNLFLHGVEWTSAMEIAIRVNSWVYTYAFLKRADAPLNLLIQIEHGILVMTDYIIKHRARFSSANNHLIIEMYAVALVGIITDHAPWRDRALDILSEELIKQNYSDGVNREMSLHYQSFVMEAYGLLWLLMVKANLVVPTAWKTYLTAMSRFIADSTDDYGTTMEFGDSDEGKIIDFNGKIENYYQYVLRLMGCLLEERYTNAPWHENLKWIVPDILRKDKKMYIPGLVSSRKEGGYTFLRSRDRRILIGIDHAALGFEAIAAHGHADALSFQMSVEGQLILVDAGTFNYHITPEDRNYFRSTVAHNTVMIEDEEQSEMLGPFMWGKKARAELLSIKEEKGIVDVSARCEGECGIHERVFLFDQMSELIIRDDIGQNHGKLFFHLNPHLHISVRNKNRLIPFGKGWITIVNENMELNEYSACYSRKYNSKKQGLIISGEFVGNTETRIRLSYDTY